MEQKKLYMVIGIVFLLLYFMAAMIWVMNFQVKLNTQDVRQAKSI